MVVMSTGHESGTRGSCIVSSAADVLGMSVVRGRRGVGRVCEMCIWAYVWPGAAWEERGWVDVRIGFDIYQSCGNRGSVGHVSVFGLQSCGCSMWGVEKGLGPGSERVGWCYVCVSTDSL